MGSRIREWWKRNRMGFVGQSLLETAIFLPVIIIMIGGVVEVSNILVAQNRVSAAARAATGYAATNFQGEEWQQVGLWSGAMVDVARNNVVDTLDLNWKRWDIWTIKATVNVDGDGFSEWIPVHAFGDYRVMSHAEWNDEDIQADVLAKLREKGDAWSSNVRIVATVAYHDRQSLLGMRAYNLGELFRVRGLTVMRLEPPKFDNGCAVLPITMYIENYSLYPEGYVGTLQPHEDTYEENLKWGGWQPASPGPYRDTPDWNHDAFPRADGGRSLWEAKTGDVFLARETNETVNPPGTLGTFGWASWDGQSSEQALDNSVTWPGNLSLQPDAQPPMVNYVNPDDPNDYTPDVGDWVMNGTGLNNSIDLRRALNDYAETGKAIQILAYDTVRYSGGNYQYQIVGFPIIKLRAYLNRSSDKRILIEFLGWDAECTKQVTN